jgi:hypothetical protein
MKRTLVLLSILLLAATAAPAREGRDPGEVEISAGYPLLLGLGGGERISFGSPVVVGAGEVVRGDVVSFGGPVTVLGTITGDVASFGGPVEVSGEVRGDVASFGGPITISGSVSGDVASTGGPVRLLPGAHVGGDVASLGGPVERAQTATVGGSIVHGFPGLTFHPFGFPWWFAILNHLAKLFVGLVILIVIAALAPVRVERMADWLRQEWGVALAAGFGVWVCAFVVGVLLCVTLIGIPVAILLIAAYKIIKFFGLAGLFLLIGRQIAYRNRADAPYMPAILIGWAPFALISLFPICIDTIIWLVLGWIGIGAVVLTRFGGPEPWRRAQRPGPAGAPVPPPVPEQAEVSSDAEEEAEEPAGDEGGETGPEEEK